MNEPSENTEHKITEILVKHNGSYRVTNLTVLVNSKGERLETKEVISLCRCGGSQTKPFCDGSHKTNGFSDDKN
jgi:CDGSH iron-sulfur domain-containing protein 3